MYVACATEHMPITTDVPLFWPQGIFHPFAQRYCSCMTHPPWKHETFPQRYIRRTIIEPTLGECLVVTGAPPGLNTWVEEGRFSCSPVYRPAIYHSQYQLWYDYECKTATVEWFSCGATQQFPTRNVENHKLDRGEHRRGLLWTPRTLHNDILSQPKLAKADIILSGHFGRHNQM